MAANLTAGEPHPTGLGVDEPTKHELMALARVANTEYQDVRLSVRRGLHHRQRELATLEQSLFTGQLVLRDPKDIDHYRALFDFFANRTLWADDARKMLHGIAGDFRSRE